MLLKKKMADSEVMALKAQMNPHFVFNSLNSIQHYFLQEDAGKANYYLTRFSMLIRKILQYSRVPYISLNEEIETLDLYLQLEKLRFKDKMNYKIEVDKNIDRESVQVPPMIIQPYVENAIQHGIASLTDRQGNLMVQFGIKEGRLVCMVDDNGTGIDTIGKSIDPTHKSMGMEMTKNRIEAINAMNDAKIMLGIINKGKTGFKEPGTQVTISFPIIND